MTAREAAKRALAFTSVTATVLELAACGQTPTLIPTRNLNRPTDMSFACMGVWPNGFSGRPMIQCHPPGIPDPAPDITHATYGLLTNSERGELAVIALDTGHLLDLNPATPGYGLAPIGSLPEAIAASDDGCRAVTANRGACDLTFIDLPRLVGPTLTPGQYTPAPGTTPLRHVTVHGASGGAIAAHPYDVIFLPQSQSDLAAQTAGENLCSDGAYVAPVNPGDPVPPRAPWRAIVTFPGCDLVAVIELPSGRIVSSARITTDGVVLTGADPKCPAECTGEHQPIVAPDSGSDADFDAGTIDPDAGTDGETPTETGPDLASDPTSEASPDGGNGGSDAAMEISSDAGSEAPLAPGSLQVGPMALLPDGARLYVGAQQAEFVTALDLTNGTFSVPASGGRIVLHEGPRGASRLRLSVDPFALEHPFVGDRGEFLYVLAGDGSMRVIDVGRRNVGDGIERECDLNIDPLQLGMGDPTQACFPMDDPMAPLLPRRPLAIGPGLHLPLTVPRDIAFATTSYPGATMSADTVVNGAFGYLLASNGTVLLVNVDPAPHDGELYTPLTHSLRDINAISFASTGSGIALNAGPARVDLAPSRPVLDPAAALTSLTGPRIEGVPSADPKDNVYGNGMTPAPTWAFFPDRSAVRGQLWTMIWEAALPETNRASGVIADPPAAGGPATLSDSGASFCHSGVLPGDVVQMTGCRNDGDCGLAESCAFSPSAPVNILGMCLDRDPVRLKELTAACERLLVTNRRYEVVRSTPNRLELRTLIDELALPSAALCQKDDDCQPAVEQPGGPHKHKDYTFQCLAVHAGEPRRCVQPCRSMTTGMADDTVCRLGMVCEDVGADATIGPLCVQGPPPSEKCFAMFTSYTVHAGKGWLMTGSLFTRFDTARADATGSCVDDSARHPLLQVRVPMNMPHCTNVPDGVAGSTLDVARTASLAAAHTTPVPNPCMFMGVNSDDPTDDKGQLHVKVLFQNPELRTIVTNLEEYFGDLLQLNLQISGGVVPTVVGQPSDIGFSIPVRIITSPLPAIGSPGTGPNPADPFIKFPYLFVIDEGRASPSASHGEVVRLNPATVLFDSFSTANPFLIE